MRVMITRPQSDAEPLAERLRSEGYEVMIEPLLTIRYSNEEPVDLAGVQAVLLTSANGVRALSRNTGERGLRVLCVGPATAAAARSLGFKDVASAGGDVEDLTALVCDVCSPETGPLIHVTGSVVAGDLSGSLKEEGFIIRREVLYDAVPSESLSPEARKAIADGKVDAVMLYSPRTAARFAVLIEEAGLSRQCRAIDAVCLSDAVAGALGELPLRRKLIASRPDQEALLDMMGGALA